MKTANVVVVPYDISWRSDFDKIKKDIAQNNAQYPFIG